MGSGKPICQDRVNNLGSEWSRNTKKDSILTEGEGVSDVLLGYTLDGHCWQDDSPAVP
jgi:hypothetical protein